MKLLEQLRPVLKMGASRCQGEDYIFQGRFERTYLSPRMAQLILRRIFLVASVTFNVAQFAPSNDRIERDSGKAADGLTGAVHPKTFARMGKNIVIRRQS